MDSPAEPPVGYGSYPDEAEDVEQQDHLLGESFDGRTPLDKTIDRIGMGSYQWTLLSLCGFGWMADNMWIQAIAIILPRIQQHYSVPDSYIGALSSSMFAGMMLGAIGWGTCSDVMGRSTAFNATLFFTALFGILASFANSFGSLCAILFFLGSSVGGSMPTDGTLLLEQLPKEKQYLVTALSIFFSFGAVLSAFVALLVLPGNSCASIPCDVDVHNQGWKYLLMSLGSITLLMFTARMIFFRLHESPRYLVHAGRPQEAIKSLQLISRFNGDELPIELADVRDHHYPHIEEVDYREPAAGVNSLGSETRTRADSSTVFDANIIEDRLDRFGELSPQSTNGGNVHRSIRPALVTAYSSTGATPVLDSHAFDTPSASTLPPIIGAARRSYDTEPPVTLIKNSATGLDCDDVDTVRGTSRRRLSEASTTSRISSAHTRRIHRMILRWIRTSLGAWWGRMSMVLAPEWLRTTILVWAAWWAMSFAYTMFNVFLPKLLETRMGPGKSQTLEESLWDVAIFTLGGCPGALAMWAILYGWTPEIFGTKVRGTACGIASALSRVGGMIAPFLGGFLLMMDRTMPVYTSVVIFAIAGFCVLLLKEDAGDSMRDRTKPDRAFVH
ncbi:hypothetical protein HYPSUDRAFT_137939 [Hypholoma sublateritium FD-334 SS-4]|uniref:Major facilitator superfamily (MFS) profile domain-containing protein n=1 Tax=Hypholoma sublateritium (strain FD-334 SS-4) TaxID=945553 RepID=A0A0D2P3M7_HYPSF|nr:hypothetical protein HYPSUDRAFT_137939 [Hypholoma sublateritium FD-334 SS-4]